MTYKLTTYKTLTGKKKIVELPKEAYGQWIVYQDDKPKYHVNCFDLKSESNQIINSLVLNQQKTIEEVLDKVNKKKNVNLSIPKAPLIEIELKREEKELELVPLPEELLN